MSQHVIIGFPEPNFKGKARCVYVGNSAHEAGLAKEKATDCAGFEEFHNLTPLRKNNPLYQPKPIRARKGKAAKAAEVEAEGEGQGQESGIDTGEESEGQSGNE